MGRQHCGWWVTRPLPGHAANPMPPSIAGAWPIRHVNRGGHPSLRFVENPKHKTPLAHQHTCGPPLPCPLPARRERDTTARAPPPTAPSRAQRANERPLREHATQRSAPLAPSLCSRLPAHHAAARTTPPAARVALCFSGLRLSDDVATTWEAGLPARASFAEQTTNAMTLA